MQKKRDWPVLNTEHFSSKLREHYLSWDNIRVFLACAKEKSFRKASLVLNMSPSTIMGRIEKLEHSLDVKLFNRIPEGISLSDEGELILQDATNMEKSMLSILRKRIALDKQEQGAVILSITEGLGSYWITPQLIEFQKQYPFIFFKLRCAMRSVDVLRLEADVSIQFQRPDSLDLIVTKLGRLHVYPFASQDYLDTYGVPTKVEDLSSHRFVQQVAPQLDETIFLNYFGQDIEDNIVLRTNASTAHFYAIEKGAGIGLLPTYIYPLGAPVVPLDIGGMHSLDIWMTYHPSIKEVPRNAILIEWLKEIFSPRKSPWFRDSFIHPNDLLKLASDCCGSTQMSRYFSATL